VSRETFAPILYVMRYSELDEAIALHNAVGAGLSSSIFTLDMREAERFMSTTGSDCGIATSTSGLPERRSAAPLAVKRRQAAVARPAPMRGRLTCVRATNTIQFRDTASLAAGVRFDI